MSKPIAVLISDIHYNIQTLELADKAMNMAIKKANELSIPLIVAGDLHDTKANMRAECVSAMLATFATANEVYILRGNHDSINEKSEEHALDFLASVAEIVDKTAAFRGLYLIPYHHDVEKLRAKLAAIPKGSTVIMHQGIQGSNSGEYIQDKSAITHDDVKDFRVISGHYHARQDIQTGRPRKGAVGLFSYIGNPYSLTYGEANDPPKGFQILMDDGTLEFVPTNLRRHHTYEITAEDIGKRPTVAYNKEDLVWVKVTGTKEQLLTLSKDKIAKALALTITFRLDLIPLATTTESGGEVAEKKLTQGELLDSLIDSLTNTSDVRKEHLKHMWRASCE